MKYEVWQDRINRCTVYADSLPVKGDHLLFESSQADYIVTKVVRVIDSELQNNYSKIYVRETK